MRNLDNFRQSVESPNVKIKLSIFAQKYIPLAKTLYAEELSNITFK